MSIELLISGASRPNGRWCHQAKPSRAQRGLWNADYIQPVAVLEFDHPTAWAGNEGHDSKEKNFIRQIHACFID